MIKSSRRIVVFGATGGTGRELVVQALAAGHAVTAMVRRPEALQVEHPQLTVRRGDVLVAEDVAAAIVGQEVVLSALGTTKRGPTTVCREGVQHMLAAMQALGVRRIVCVSAAALGDGVGLAWPLRMFLRHVLVPLFRGHFDDLRAMEATLRASDLDWTIVRPPRLTHGPRTGRHRVAIEEPLPRGTWISRAELAAYMLAHLDDPAIVRRMLEVAD